QVPVRHAPWDEGALAGKAPPSQVSQESLMIPSPHSCVMHMFGPPPVSAPLPSSHCSPPLTRPSPHTVQSARQVLPFPPAGVFGGSQVSPGSTIPSPHSCGMQLSGQLSVSMLLPSSQNSPPLTIPSPQKLQSVRQVRPEGASGWNVVWSQVSPDPGCKRPSPQEV